MTETQPTLTTSSPIPVLAYEEPGLSQIDAQRTLWWIFCGGVAYGLLVTASSILALASMYLLPKGVKPPPASAISTVLRILHPAGNLVFAFICWLGLRRRRSSDTIGTAMLIITAIFFLIWLIFLFFPNGNVSQDARARFWMFVSSVVALPVIIFWPVLVWWAIAPFAAPDGHELRRRLYACVAVTALAHALSTAAQLQYLPGLVARSGRGLSFFIEVITNVIVLTLFTLAAMRKYENRSLIAAAFALVVIGTLTELAITWTPVLRTPSTMAGSIYFPVILSSIALGACAGGVMILVAFIVSRQSSRETTASQF